MSQAPPVSSLQQGLAAPGARLLQGCRQVLAGRCARMHFLSAGPPWLPLQASAWARSSPSCRLAGLLTNTTCQSVCESHSSTASWKASRLRVRPTSMPCPGACTQWPCVEASRQQCKGCKAAQEPRHLHTAAFPPGLSVQCNRLPSQKVTAIRHSNKTDLLLLLLHCLVEQRVPLQLPYCHLSKAAVQGLQNVSRPTDSIALKIQKALTDREVPGPTSTM